MSAHYGLFMANYKINPEEALTAIKALAERKDADFF